MDLLCSACRIGRHVYLHRGRLYCFRCLPAEELPLIARARWATIVAQEMRAEVRRRRRARCSLKEEPAPEEQALPDKRWG